MQIGFLGLGQMGVPMSRNVGRRFPVIGWDIRTEAIEAAGLATPDGPDSPAALARRAEVTVLMVRDAPQAEQVLFGPDGYLEGATEGHALIVMSSLRPGFVAEVADQLAGRGVDVLDAPVSGGVEGATAATLTVMAAGRSEVLDRCRPVLDLVGGRVVDVGRRPGLGQTVKVMNQLAYFSNLVVAGEALVVAAKAGVDPDIMLDVLSTSSGDSWALRHRAPLAWRNEYVSGGALSIALKDLTAATGLADELGIPLTVGAATARLAARSTELWGAEGDDPLLVKTVEHLGDTWLAQTDPSTS